VAIFSSALQADAFAAVLYIANKTMQSRSDFFPTHHQSGEHQHQDVNTSDGFKLHLHALKNLQACMSDQRR
jgi:hypothetical protein